MNISEVQEIFTEKGIDAKVMPGMRADILVIFVKQDYAKIKEALTVLKEKEVKVFKFINTEANGKASGKLKIK